MTIKRIIPGILTIAVFCMIQGLVHAGPSTESEGPPMGKWQFIGEDDKGVSWNGVLKVQKLDTSLFDAERFHSMSILNATFGDSSYGVEAPCKWVPIRREVSFGTGNASFTAILSPDGKSMIQGKWTESERDHRTRKANVTRTGNWSAKFVTP